jgi:tRNA1(Val) A37 N6-methylase TrmN6
MDTTLDGLLDRRVMLEQPAKGYRVAIDTVLLAAAVPAQAGESVLDLGCGVGGAMLCLACRAPGAAVTGIEIQLELAELARRNIARNSFPCDMKIIEGDATRLPENFAGVFDHVLMNPPYHAEAQHDISPNVVKRAANTEKEGDLALWIASAATALKNSGILTLIHRADRRDELLKHLVQSFGTIEILPIAPKPDTSPQRIIVRARKTGQASVRQSKILVLHKPDGGYTEAAESILRHAKSMEFIGEMT